MEENYDLGKYVDRLYSAAVKKTRDAQAAQDIAQETFLAALSQLSRGKKPDNLWAWLLTIISNKYCDWLREKYNRPQISFEAYPLEIAREEAADDDSAEKLEAIRRELGYLGRLHREVMIRFYMYGQTVDRIARDLQIPAGTVKSRLNIGRRHVRKGVTDMENYTRQSYAPDTLHIACSGGEGLNHEPFSLVPDSDKLAQSILILAYPKPLTETELARALGVPAAFVEPVTEKLVQGELMKRTDGGKVYTDFIIYTDKDRKATFEKQLAIAEEHFGLFWEEMEQGLGKLRGKSWYQRQTEHARAKLELHFCVKTLMNAHISVRDEVTGAMPWSKYPYRQDGGRWIAMGMQYRAGSGSESEEDFWKYGVDGETGFEERNFRDARYLEGRGYGTFLGGQHVDYERMAQYVKWFYELQEKIPVEESALSARLLQDAESLIEQGFLRRAESLELDIPAISRAEYQEECSLSGEYAEKIAVRIREVLLPIFESGYVRLPAHLKSVPKWQQYMFCGDSVPMAVIYKAMEKGLFLDGVKEPLPAFLMVYDKA
ncbi:MAG: RNA polymerase sigma factor [Lachnospiraceae bacterium]|jgi:RNA polymerase sigma factor (sigma-70 family)|nr:RNA polymerase sigma factor [Lachnospiraceae bacterium]